MSLILEQQSTTATSLRPLEDLVRKAQAGDYSVLPELRQALDANASIWQRGGDLALQAQAAWLQLLSGQDLLLHECVELKMQELRTELEGPEPTPLERLLVERILACWLQTNYADSLYAQARGPESTTGVRQELMKRQESSQRRYLVSIKQLALVRKLLRPGLSPFELAMRSVNETPSPGRRQTASSRPLRVADLN